MGGHPWMPPSSGGRVSSQHAQMVAHLLAGRTANSEGWVRVNCPMCAETQDKPDRRASLGIRADTGIYKCFRCGAKGRARGFSDSAQRSPRDPEPEVSIQLPDGFVLLGSGDGATAEATRRAREYLSRRGVGLPAIQEARIGYAEDAKGVPRIVVPVLGADSSLRGWVARALAPSVVPKYLNASGVWASHVVFNEAALLRRTDTPLMVVEGVFDALPYWPDAVATLGKSLKGSQFDVLLRSRRPLAVCYDGDAHEAGWSLSCQLQLFGAQAVAVRLPAATDPNTVDTHWLRAEVARAVRGGV